MNQIAFHSIPEDHDLNQVRYKLLKIVSSPVQFYEQLRAFKIKSTVSCPKFLILKTNFRSHRICVWSNTGCGTEMADC